MTIIQDKCCYYRSLLARVKDSAKLTEDTLTGFTFEVYVKNHTFVFMYGQDTAMNIPVFDE